jgi:hypothetical protein
VSGRLERRYRRLLVTYPAPYRAAHGDEIIGTLLDAAPPTQRFPAPREAGGLLLGGLRTRARQAATATPPRVWTDGLHLGVLLIVLANLGQALQLARAPWTALVAVGVLAVLRGWARTALVATALAALAAARPLLPPVGLPWWLPGYGDWSAVARYVVPAAVLVALAWPQAGRLRPRSWWWLLLPAAQLAFPAVEQSWVAAVEAGLEAGLLIALVVVAVAALDPRPAVALAVFLTPGLFHAAEQLTEGAMGPRARVYWTVVALLTVGLVAVAWRIGWVQHRDR